MRWLGTVALLGCVALTAIALGGGDDGTSGAGGLDPYAGWTTERDAERGLSLRLPPGWERARRNLTPGLADPHEILSVGSYRPRYVSGSRCAIPGCPLPALDDFGSDDVLISIQERG